MLTTTPPTPPPPPPPPPPLYSTCNISLGQYPALPYPEAALGILTSEIYGEHRINYGEKEACSFGTYLLFMCKCYFS